MIAAPWLVSWEVVEADPRQRHLALRENSANRFLHLAIPDVDVHVFHLHEMADQLRVHRRYRVVFFGETDSFRTRPGEPGAGVWLPLGRHAEAKLSGRRGAARAWRSAHGRRCPRAATN